MCGLGTELGFNPAVTPAVEAAVSDLLGGFLSHSWEGWGEDLVGGTQKGRRNRAGKYGWI